MDPKSCTPRENRKSIDDDVKTSQKKTTSTESKASAINSPSRRIQWMWNSSADPFSKSQPVEWHRYRDIESEIIEEAFTAGKAHTTLDGYHIDFEHNLQSSSNNPKKQRPIKRMECNGDEKRVRSERFLSNPVAPKRPYGDVYGFISPFVKEVAKDLSLKKKKLPSKNSDIVPMIVEKAALGIVEEGKEVGKQIQAERMAKMLREKKEAEMRDVWICCAHLYTMDTFLFKKMNEAMRSIGSEEHETIWRSKLHTLGSFCLLLWDNPFNSESAKPGTILYRGTQLSDDLISSFKDDCSKNPKPSHSFQAFTSCTRDRNVAEMFGNTILIMKVGLAFTVDLKTYSNFPDEEEELLFPGVYFTIDQMKVEEDKHLIYLTLQQRHNSKST
ncbi:unnamed protein product [Didymodactylos carnosus]|uniref:NAD(P)(+)--arginine ADP-ribosyltransferase n=1 Tax=Didymodactylos carnosus TaxID=1234261 RepID=A0A814QKA6_9BILA|nr:unnamed protein product [Didymodactylos carnosus]CAF1146996.1 unnamed protein product [Didymodactylos carnosus]CAF3884551.1 unnamed protein product [Didymodactylos carnosus]CAF3949580.1 unnamed protein product [Didymodactylos carnosus]